MAIVVHAAQQCSTVDLQVFMNSQGRAIALATCYVLSGQSVLMTTCPGGSSFLQQHLEKYILYGDEAGTLLMMHVHPCICCTLESKAWRKSCQLQARQLKSSANTHRHFKTIQSPQDPASADRLSRPPTLAAWDAEAWSTGLRLGILVLGLCMLCQVLTWALTAASALTSLCMGCTRLYDKTQASHKCMQVSVKDASGQCAMFALVGRGSEQLLRGMGALLPESPAQPSTSGSDATGAASEHACAMQQVRTLHGHKLRDVGEWLRPASGA